MRLITINPNNEPYYSEDFIKGFKCGAQRQFEADKSDADRPQGEWIIEIDVNGNTYGRCSICGMRQYAGQLNYCPNCGAQMKGADDE